MLAACGDSEVGEEEEQPAKDTCLMALHEETSGEVAAKSKAYLKKIQNLI